MLILLNLRKKARNFENSYRWERRIMKITILGGAGYIRTHLIKILLGQKHKVSVLDRMIFGEKPVDDFKGDPNFILVRGDIRNIRDVSRSVGGAETVIHLAGLVGDPACQVDEDITWSHNTESSVVIADVCNYYKIERLLFASSCSVYGAAPSEIILNEGSYKNPVSLYAQTKIDSEQIFAEKFNGVYSALRLATVFGYSRRMRFDLVANLFTIKAMKEGKISVFGGTQYRPFIHCYDVARAFDALVNAPSEKIDREVFNVSCENYTIRGLAEVVQKVVEQYVPCKLELVKQKEDNRNYKVSSEKINWILKFKPKTSMINGVEGMVAMIKKKGYKDWESDLYRNSSWEY